MTNLENSLKQNKKISKRETIDYINSIVRKCGLSNYINNIVLNSNGSKYSSYDFNTNILEINYDLINKIYSDNKLFNMNLILSIFKEITHAIQKSEVFDNETYKKYPTYYVFLTTDYFFIINKCKDYISHINNYTIERTANICSFINTIELYKSNNIDHTYLDILLYNYRKSNTSLITLNFNIENLNVVSKEVLVKYKNALNNFDKDKKDILTEKEIKIYKK